LAEVDVMEETEAVVSVGKAAQDLEGMPFNKINICPF